MDMNIEPKNLERSTSPVLQNGDCIKPIGKDTVHRICSGQVVLNLAIAVKELVENAIDAGASIIEVKLKDYGMELVEVSDNGCGVKEENYAALALKHYTSKIKEFSDLESLGTLGFRGEALSSLCALSDLTITTRHESLNHAMKLQYDHGGNISSQTPIARSVGTTVTLANLFSTLPVRRKEYVKNHKREFNKMCTLLYAYCLVAKGIKITCTNVTSKGSSCNVVSTPGSKLTRDNIISVFGSKQLSSLIEVELTPPDETIAQEFSITTTPGDDQHFEFEFYISSVIHGSGRSATDRQFFYVNSRPCEPTKLAKLINDAYRQFNSHQYPFVFLNVTVKNSLVDVNVTPDKRQVFMEKEKLLLATVKMSLMEAFKDFPSTFKVENQGLAESFSKGNKRELEVEKSSILESFRKKSKSNEEDSVIQLLPPPKSKVPVTSTLFDVKGFKIKIESKESSQQIEGNLNSNEISKKPTLTKLSNIYHESSINLMEEESVACSLKVAHEARKNISKKRTATIKNDIAEIDSGVYRENRRSTQFTVSMDAITSSLLQTVGSGKANAALTVRFHSTISPSSNKAAESELQKQITKDMFGQMRIVGQFNYAFIVVALGNDLFIIDQHATDEKYNFEELQKNTVLESQVLVIPKELQLTAAHENILIENEDIFKKNGFHFIIDENAEATKKIRLTKIPVSKNYIFGKDDIDEMLYMLQEGCSDINCRPSRVRGMFASRACRKSVMVGRPLTKNDMRRLVDHMGEIDHPWNCPHGRPTMRHLVNLKRLHKD